MCFSQNTSSTAASTETDVASNPEKPVKVNRPQIFFPQPVFVPFQQQQQPAMPQQLPQQPVFHPPANMPHHRPITPPVIEAGFQPIVSSQGFQNQPHPIHPGQVFGLRPVPPQQGPTTPIQSTRPVLPKDLKNTTVSTAKKSKSNSTFNDEQNLRIDSLQTTTQHSTRRPLRPQFGLSVPTPPPNPSPPPAPHIQMRPPTGNVPFQPLQRPPPPPQRSSGFFSSLLGMFS